MDPIPHSEAAYLLQGGSLYLSRVGLSSSAAAGLVFAGFKKGAFSLYFDDAPIYHFDLEGRWQRAFVGQTHYLKSLDASIQAVDRVREGTNMVLRRRRLDGAEARLMDVQVRGVAMGLLSELAANRLRAEGPPDGRARHLGTADLAAFLKRIADWDEQAWETHRARYAYTYGPLPLLPPDCQHAVILQATVGKAAGSVFGRGDQTVHRIRTPDEFREHLGDVVALIGGRLRQSRLAFLDGSEAILQEPRWVENYLDAAAEVLPIGQEGAVAAEGDEANLDRLDGIHAFVDRFDSPRPDLAALQGFRRRHLTGVSLGIASGDPAVRERLATRWTDEDLRAFVADLRAAGIRISVLTLAGAGGTEGEERHASRTYQLLESLELTTGENVFVLDAGDALGRGDAEEPAPRSAQSPDALRDRLKEALTPLRSRGVKVLVYAPEKHWA
jgi:hypothetical protein